ncbi:MAG: hypothetical protein WDN30_13175 [Pararobbsia sp.]
MRLPGEAPCHRLPHTKGLFKAQADVRQVDNGLYQGWVNLSRDDGEDPDDTLYQVSRTAFSARSSCSAAARPSFSPRVSQGRSQCSSGLKGGPTGAVLTPRASAVAARIASLCADRSGWLAVSGWP